MVPNNHACPKAGIFKHPSKVQFPVDLKCSSDIQLRTRFFIYLLHISANDSYGFTE